MGNRLSRIIWVAGTICVLGRPGVAIAGPYRVDFVIAPTYAFCVSGPACTPAGRTSFALEYKPIVNRRNDLRIKLSRDYERSIDDPALDDIEVVSSRLYQAAANTLDLRLRCFDADGYEWQEPRAGYSYEFPDGGAGAHHTFFISEAAFFGRRIRRGTESPAHQFRVSLKFTKDGYETAGTFPQTFVQASAYATFPLQSRGFWRVELGYTAQQQLVKTDGLTPYSTRVSTTLTHDFSRETRAYLRFDANLSTGSNAGPNPRAASATLGAKFTL